MSKLHWLNEQIEAAFKGAVPDPVPEFLTRLVAEVEGAGEGLSRSAFMKIFERVRPEGSGADFCNYMILGTQLSYVADFSEAWATVGTDALPEIKMRAKYRGTSLPEDFVKIGGTPEWIQDEAFPICEECDRDMVLFAQFKSLPTLKKFPELAALQFGDDGNLYFFTCPGCATFKTDWQCH